MSHQELPPKYNPQDHEEKIYDQWEKSGIFSPPKRKKGETTFSILMPPPNANGALHVGHGVFVTVEDVMTRYHRMKGDATVWFPGLDHAGFETQVVFEKVLEKQGKSRFNMERDEFYNETLKFTLDNSKTILSQFKKFGASADWKRLKFTLDSDVIEKVHETFVRLYDDGLAYRASRPVHWCSYHQTTLSDLEVKDQEQVDSLYYIKYGPFIVATVRPETIFGDVAVAVHPNDPRYQEYVDTEIEVDFGLEARKIPVVADEMVDPKFGTGVVKITPAHDANDFEVAIRHGLLTDRTAVNQFGKLTDLAGKFSGLKVIQAREEVVEMLRHHNLLEKIDQNYRHNVKVCYKCNRTIEPRVIPQWFIAVSKKGDKTGKILAKDAHAAVKKRKVGFATPKFEKIFDHWMSNIRDWNISRQIAWGIRLPVWYCHCSATIVQVPKSTEIIFLRHGESQHNELKIGNGDPSKPFHLTAKGRKQVAATIEEFTKAGIKFDSILASEMPRVQQTANIVADKLDGDIITDRRLNDIHLGGLEGRLITDLHLLTGYHQKSVEGSETFEQVKARVTDFLKDLHNHHANKKRILVVTSEIVFWALRAVLNPDSTPHEQRHRVPNASWHKFNLGDLSPCLECGKLATQRDTDVFDTWFSSGQWPVIVPQTTGFKDDFDRFYPTSVMETGWDILFFWVARMIMLGLYMTNKVPFRDVYLHGMVRDKDRQKMSKSKGNVMDPLAVIDEYGADALRMALIFGTAAGNDMPMGEEKIRGMRNFTNKLWNVSRFILMNLEFKIEDLRFKISSDADRKILEKLGHTIKLSDESITQYRFHEYAQGVYQFLWSDLADTYIEAAKKQLHLPERHSEQSEESRSFVATAPQDDIPDNTRIILLHILVQTLKLLHPITPFVTEAIWQQLPDFAKDNKFLAASEWPRIKAEGKK